MRRTAAMSYLVSSSAKSPLQILSRVSSDGMPNNGMFSGRGAPGRTCCESQTRSACSAAFRSSVTALQEAAVGCQNRGAVLCGAFALTSRLLGGCTAELCDEVLQPAVANARTTTMLPID